MIVNGYVHAASVFLQMKYDYGNGRKTTRPAGNPVPLPVRPPQIYELSFCEGILLR